MGKARSNRWKKVCAMLLAAAMAITMMPVNAMAGTSSDLGNGTFQNPVIYSDVPDLDMIRVGDAYYMISTTMHLSPGCPVMKSTDLVNWEIVNYVFDRLGTEDAMSLRNGKSMYGNGQWASSLQYHDGVYYVAFNSNTTGKAYIFTTNDIEGGSWTKQELDAAYHDMALFFDDNGKTYILYGGTQIRCVELKEDLSGAKEGSEVILFDSNAAGEKVNASGKGFILGYEGTHILKKDGYYYVFNICWPNGAGRTEVCHRSKTFPTTEWENEVILQANFSNFGTTAGVAQGGVIDTQDGKWYGFLFQDHGAVGRVPVLTDCTWKDGWPMLGKDGDGKTVEAVMELPISGSSVKSIVKSDEFYNDAEHREFAASASGQAQGAGEAAAVSNEAPMAGAAADGAEPTVTYEKKAGEEEAPKPDPGDGSLVEVIENGGFETGDATGWQMTRTESGELEVVTDEKASGDYSIHAFNRENCGAGPCQNISGKLKRGKTYTISGKIKYTAGPDTKQFYVTIENGDNYNWRENLVSIQARKGEWTSFSGTYTVHDKSEQFPFDPNQNYIFVETPWAASPSAENDLMDFYLDDFSMTTESDNMIQNGSFENGIEPWTGMENASVSVTEEEAQDGAFSAVTTGRTACAQGPCQDLSNKMTPGNIYTITAYIKYKTGADSKAFNMTIQNGPDYNYRSILGSVTAARGEWTKLEVTYAMPEDAISTQNYLFFETPWVANPTAENDLMDFYVDNVTMTEQVPDKKVEEAGENDYNGSNLDLVWQWNHNPNNNYWSLTERSGWLRLTAGSKANSILEARNTLTQRTYGPTCSGKVKMDISNMKAGDVAGLASFSYNYGYIAVKKEASGAKLVMVDASSNSVKGKDEPEEKASVDCEGDIVYLKEDFDFAGGDKVGFYYSFDGDNWQQLGTDMKLTYELTHFMGSRFALFHYATRSAGGYVDFDYFRVSDQITGAEHGSSAGKAELSNTGEVSGVINSTCEVKMTLDPLPAEGHSSLKASISIPDIMEVEDVAFQESAIQGKADYSCKGGRLTLSVKGDNVSFQAADRLFATIKLKLKNYVDQDTAASLKADYVMVDKGTMEYDVSGCATTVNLKYLDTGALAKKLGYGNPLMTQEFGADPYAIVYDGRVYVYMTADDYQYDANGEIIENNYGYIRSLRVISSDDMMNWTDHGEIKVAGEDGAAKWAAHSWAPAIAYKQIEGKDKFFLYFANDASGIGVLEADTPLGPWKDPIGKALITRQTPGCQDVVWCFDPAVLVDDDGSAYIYFGGGVPDGQQINPKTARVAKLGADMISIDGEAKLIDAPCMFEDSGIFKYNGKYYYNYCTNFISPHGDGGPGYGTICYMESDDPMGPYTYKGEIFQNPANWFGVGGNNHHATFVFEGQSYFIYHAQTVSKEQGVQKGYRSTHIDKIEFYGDGSIKPIKGTYAGIPQLREVSAFGRIEAETIAWNKGIKVSQCSAAGGKFNEFNRQLTDLQDGDWAAVSQVSFGEKGAKSFTANVASEKGGKIEIRLDSPQGALIGTLNVEATGSESTFKALECDVDQVTGIRNVFFVFRGTASGNLMNVDYYQFHEKATEPGPGPAPVPADTSKLSAKITEAEALLGKLSAEAKAELQAAIQAAKGILEKENASQEEVDAALAALSKTVEEKKKEQEDKEKYSLQKAKIAAIPAQAYTGKAKKPSITLTYGSKKLVKGKDYVVSYKNNIKIGTATVTATGKGDYTGSISRKFTITVKKNAVYTVGNYKYKITSAKTNGKGTVTLTGVKSSTLKKKLTKGVVADTVKIGGKKFQVTAIGSKAFQGCKKLSSVSIGKYVKTIGKQAFYQCKKLKKITIKGTALKSVGKNALKGIYSKAVILCPKKQMAKYKKLCKASIGFKKTMKWKAGK